MCLFVVSWTHGSSQDMKTLEENVEQTLLREEQALEAEEAALNGSGDDDVVALQKSLKEMKMKYEVGSIF